VPQYGDPPVEIASADPEWAARFRAEKTVLLDVLGPWLAGPIEHIGSTAVPGLAAKPVIDIMAAVESLDASRPAIAAVERLGYCYAPYRTDREHWFCKPSFRERTHHLHLVPAQSASWIEAITFRDVLRSEPAVAREYEALKRLLAEEFRHDREAYTNAKGPFVAAVVGRALGGGASPVAES
jgi:GrpB-like predicted nucleotidyltransferase (UPF0157 family)